jgi:hypothetical protein
MPDGDRIYGRLSQGYEKPYEQICEWYFSPNEIAYNLLEAIKRDLEHNENAPITLIEQVAQQFEQLPLGIFASTINWRKESREIDYKASYIQGHKRALALAVEACKRHLHAVMHGAESKGHRSALIAAYVTRVYEDCFVGRTPSGPHFSGVDHETFMERLHIIRGFVVESLEASYVRQIAQTGSVFGLRRPARSPFRVELDTNLLRGEPA